MKKLVLNKKMIIYITLLVIIAIGGAAYFLIQAQIKKDSTLSLEECKQTIAAANNVIDQVVLQKTGGVIGKIDNLDITEFSGNYKDFSTLSTNLSQYYSRDKDIYLDLVRRGVYVINKKLGILKSSDISPFVTNEATEYTVLNDMGNIKTVQVKSVFRDKVVSASYTLEKFNKKYGIRITKLESTDDYNLYYMVKNFEASSVDSGSKPENAMDNNRLSAWVGTEGKKSKSFIKFDYKKPVEISSISISNGNAQTRSLYGEYNRVRKAVVEFSDGTKVNAVFEDITLFAQAIKLPKKIKTDYVKVTIESVYSGKIDKNCISEVIVKGK